MKPLFDENLSPRLPKLLANSFPGSLHLRDCGLKGAMDSEVWEYARVEGCIVVSKDRDFYELSLLRGAPPKFIWLRTGNCTRASLLKLLTEHVREISEFAANATESLLIISDPLLSEED